jgi:hypothetical protein
MRIAKSRASLYRQHVRAFRGLLAFAGILAVAGPAAAHLGLRYPPSRYGDNVLKVGPCGLAGGARSRNVTVLEPGATIDVVWDEYVDHPGHFRISFDVDGDNDFVDPACLGKCNTTSPTIELYSNTSVLLDGIADTPHGGQSGAKVTLPDVQCERCTLQVIQVMYDKPPYVTPGNDIYYQCADLVLRRAVAPTPTASPTPSPALPTPSPPCGDLGAAGCAVGCVGDCDGGGEVSVDELVAMVGIALGITNVSACRPGDADGDGAIQIDEIVAAVQRSLEGCPRS